MKKLGSALWSLNFLNAMKMSQKMPKFCIKRITILATNIKMPMKRFKIDIKIIITMITFVSGIPPTK